MNTYLVGTKVELEEGSGAGFSKFPDAAAHATKNNLLVKEITWEYVDSEYISGFYEEESVSFCDIVIVKIDGTTEDRSVKKEDLFKTLARSVGGYVEVVNASPDHCFAVNENGRIENLERNKRYPQFCGNIVLFFSDDLD